MELGWIFVKDIICWIINRCKRNEIKSKKVKNKRGTFSKYKGITDTATKIEITTKNNESQIKIIFSAFNDRFNIFEPLSNYHIESFKRQKVSIKDKEYLKHYSQLHSTNISQFSIAKRVKNGQIQVSDFDFDCEHPEDFFHLLKKENTANITFITGDVGCGKSTFIAHVLYLLGQHINITDNARRLAAVCVNASNNNDEDLHSTTTEDAYKSFTQENRKDIIYKLFELSFCKNFKKINIQNQQDFVNVVKKHFLNHQLTIFIDNLDEIYDQSSTLILKTEENNENFETHYKNRKYNHIAITLFSIIREIIDTVSNVRFVLGMRKETYGAVMAEYESIIGAAYLSREINYETIELKNCNIKQIIDNRFKLIENGNNDFLEFAQNFSREAEKIKINGTRHIIASLRFLSDMDPSKLFYRNWMIRLYIYLDGLCTYSQKDCGICNIFLINIDYRNNIDEYDDLWIKETKEDHFQTYWLKYLICAYFNKKPENNNTSTEIYNNLFKKYEKSIFNFCIYSLSEVKHGRLISCEFQKSTVGLNRYVLSKTDRLTYCLDNNIFFSFEYLSVIVDDLWLEFPKFKKGSKEQNIMSNLFSEQYKYNSIFIKDDKLWQDWLVKSINKVFVFLAILKNSLDYEKKKNTEEIISLFPDIDQELENIKDKVKNIATTINMSNDSILKEIELAEKQAKVIGNKSKKHSKKYRKFMKKKQNL